MCRLIRSPHNHWSMHGRTALAVRDMSAMLAYLSPRCARTYTIPCAHTRVQLYRVQYRVHCRTVVRDLLISSLMHALDTPSRGDPLQGGGPHHGPSSDPPRAPPRALTVNSNCPPYDHAPLPGGGTPVSGMGGLVPCHRPKPQPVILGTPIPERQIGWPHPASLGRCEFEGRPSTHASNATSPRRPGRPRSRPGDTRWSGLLARGHPYPAPKLPGRGGGAHRIRTGWGPFGGGTPPRRPPWTWPARS